MAQESTKSTLRERVSGDDPKIVCQGVVLRLLLHATLAKKAEDARIVLHMLDKDAEKCGYYAPLEDLNMRALAALPSHDHIRAPFVNHPHYMDKLTGRAFKSIRLDLIRVTRDALTPTQWLPYYITRLAKGMYDRCRSSYM